MRTYVHCQCKPLCNINVIVTKTRAAEYKDGWQSSRTRFTEEEVLDLLDSDGENGEAEDPFFPGSYEEIGHVDTDTEGEDIEEEEEDYTLNIIDNIIKTRINYLHAVNLSLQKTRVTWNLSPV